MYLNSFYHSLRSLAYLSLGATSRMLNLPSQPIIILSYHSIGEDGWPFSISKQNFIQQVNYLSQTRTFVSLSEIENHIKHQHSLPKPAVAITFDDGYQNILQITDFLKSKSIRPGLFVTSAKQVNREQLGNKLKLLTTSQIKALAAQGWEIGSHTATHPDLTQLPPQQIEQEIIKSRIKLEKTMGFDIKYIAYPKGKCNQAIIQASRKGNYRMGFTIDDRPIDSQVNHLLIPRIGVDRYLSFTEFKYLSEQLVTNYRQIIRKIGYEI